jgi:hypothetical protein
VQAEIEAVNRIGRRTILAMLLIATIVAIWTVFGRYG